MDFFKLDKIKSSWMFIAFGLKVLASLGLVLIYSAYYPNREEADIFKYYDDAVVIHNIYEENPEAYVKMMLGLGDGIDFKEQHFSELKYWDRTPSLPFLNDNRLIIRFNALLIHISNGNIYMHMIFASFLAFLGLSFLYKGLVMHFEGREKWLFAGIFLMPSLLFWTSGVLKEAFMILGFGGLIYYAFSWMGKPSLKKLLLILFFLWLLTSSKMYIILALLPALGSYYWQKLFPDKKIFLRYLVINMLVIGLILNASSYLNMPDFKTQVINKQSEFKCLAEWIGAGSQVYVPDIDYNLWSFVKAAPHALYNVLMRPFIWSNPSPLSIPASLEIHALLLLLLASIIFRKKLSPSDKNLLLFSLNIILILSLIIGWTTPVMGAIVRYRIPILPLLLLIPIMLLDQAKLFNFVSSKLK